MSDEACAQDVPVFTYSHEEYIPPVSKYQLEQALYWSVTGLPHRVDMLPSGEALIHLSSGRTVRITASIEDGDDSAHLSVHVHEIDEADVPEMMAIHQSLMQTTMFVTRVMWARQQALA